MAWITSLFIIVSGILLFGSWARAFRLKALASDVRSRKEWGTFRAVVLITLIAYFITFMTAVNSGPVAVANMLAIVLALGSLATWSSITYFRAVCNVAPGFGGEFPQAHVPRGEPAEMEIKGVEESMRVLTHDMRNSIAVVKGLAESLRDSGADSADDLREVASTIVGSARKMNTLVDQLEAVYRGPGLSL
jgi:signal transduction histidine kinase